MPGSPLSARRLDALARAALEFSRAHNGRREAEARFELGTALAPGGRTEEATEESEDSYFVQARYFALYQKVQLLMLRWDLLAALPWAEEAVRYAAARSGAEDRALEVQMRLALAAGYREQDDIPRAEEQFI